MLRTKQKNNKKSLPGPVRQSFPQIWRLNPVLKLVGFGFREVWDSLWCLSAGFGALLGGSWLLLGSPEQALGTYLAALGHLLAGLGRFLEGFWSPGPPRGLRFKGPWRVPGSRFPMVFAAPCALLPNAFF